MNYHQQIKHPLWQKKRLEVLEFHNFQCQECRAKEEELHVHHPFYKRGAMIWDYDKTELDCLCHKCHKDAHSWDERFKKKLALAPLNHKRQALAYLETLLTFDHKSNGSDEAVLEGISDALRPRVPYDNMRDMFYYFVSVRDKGTKYEQ